MSKERITQREYFEQCREVAREAVTEAEGDRDTAADLICQTVDQHEWIIYTYRNLQVLEHTRCENACFDIGGSVQFKDFSTCMAQLACAAMTEDCLAELDEALEEYPDNQEETQS